MSHQSLPPGRPHFVLAAAVMQNEGQERELLKHMSSVGVARDEAVKRALLRAAALRGDYKNAEKRLQHIRVHHPSFADTPVVWNSLLDCYAIRGDWKAIVRTWQRLRGAGVKPNSTSYVKVCSAAAALAETPDDAWVKRTELAAEAAHRAGFSREPRVWTALMQAYAHSGDAEKAAVALRLARSRLGDTGADTLWRLRDLAEKRRKLREDPDDMGGMREWLTTPE
eukprot:Hpha_TRINITY_DN33974_c0_g1::TRINITY_DN33974_c0_g1_i1::g.69557::m.69557